MLQLVQTNKLIFQIKTSIRDAQIPQPCEKSMNSMRIDSFQLLHIFVDIRENTVNVHIFCVPTDINKCVDNYGFTSTEVWWMWPFNGRF